MVSPRKYSRSLPPFRAHSPSSCTGVVLNNNYCYSKNNVYLKENFNQNSASVLALKGTCAGQYKTGTVPDAMNKACCWS